ncbi:PLD nuclease N-terminal domain-containing protein [Dactylosporangium sp. NBC_01737]|uniref:PLD nuclease N-terminal domain-containing protein n=1 Tax=Dactylosporangium sp. NBC_01737 TaxID=2975959 RepID=UPI002E12F714|nr:PLD nuclease N-terminal domain-containing protein [Dactylosporangium sp. NBC_01737]
MGRALPFLIVLVATLVALIDCLSTDRDDVRGLPKVVWCLVILLLPVVGVIAWFFAGRPLATEQPAGVPPAGGSRRRQPKPVAPDDDPEFLRGIDTSRSRDDAELLRRWEEDLKRREEEG